MNSNEVCQFWNFINSILCIWEKHNSLFFLVSTREMSDIHLEFSKNIVTKAYHCHFPLKSSCNILKCINKKPRRRCHSAESSVSPRKDLDSGYRWVSGSECERRGKAYWKHVSLTFINFQSLSDPFSCPGKCMSKLLSSDLPGLLLRYSPLLASTSTILTAILFL